MVTTVEQRAAQVGDAALKMKQPITRRPDAPAMVIPLLRMSAVESAFTLGSVPTSASYRSPGTPLVRSTSPT